MEPEMTGGSAWYKNKTVLGVLALVVIVGGVMLVRGDNDDVEKGTPNTNTNEQANLDEKPRAGEIAVVGKLGCTPLKSGAAPTSAECVLGLVGDDGKFYALETSKVEAAEKGIEPTTSIKIIGKFSPADAASEEAGVFKYDGVMAVRLLLLNN